MIFFIAQTFKGTSPPEAALWCNANNAMIVSIDGGYRIDAIPAKPFATVRDEKIAELNAAFSTAEQTGYVSSSLGFSVDATERANRDIAGLITVMSQDGAPASTYFCDYGNIMRVVTLDNLRTMQLEVITHGRQLYARKWALRTAIEAAQSMEDLQTIVIDLSGGDTAQNGEVAA